MSSTYVYGHRIFGVNRDSEDKVTCEFGHGPICDEWLNSITKRLEESKTSAHDFAPGLVLREKCHTCGKEHN